MPEILMNFLQRMYVQFIKLNKLNFYWLLSMIRCDLRITFRQQPRKSLNSHKTQRSGIIFVIIATMILSAFDILSLGDRYCRFKMFIVYSELRRVHHRKYLIEMFSFASLFRTISVKILPNYIIVQRRNSPRISEYFTQSSHSILQS